MRRLLRLPSKAVEKIEHRSRPGADVESQERFATIGGHRMRYLKCGEGPRLILIHGLMAFSFSWRFTLPALSAHFTCYAVDLMGTGYSDRVPGLACDFESQGRRMLQFMDAIGVTSAEVMGTSHGGAVAMTMAAQAPERVQRLVLVAPANPWSRIGSLLAAIVGSRIGGYLFCRYANRWDKAALGRMQRMFGDPSRMPPDSFPSYMRAAAAPGSLEHVSRMMASWHADQHQLELSLPRIAHIPALLVWGSRDRIVDPRSAEKLKATFTNAKLAMMEGVGHLPYEEAPEEFNSIVLEWLLSRASS